MTEVNLFDSHNIRAQGVMMATPVTRTSFVSRLPLPQAEVFVDIGNGHVTLVSTAGVFTDLHESLAAYQLVTGKNAANGYAGLSAGSKIAGAQVLYGTGSNEACEGDDARLSDDRDPNAHNHAAGDTTTGTFDDARISQSSVTQHVGAIDHGSQAGLGDDDHAHYSKADGTRAFTAVVAGVTPVGSADLTTKGYVDGLAPNSHAATHQNGGADEIDVTDLSGLLGDPQTPVSHTHAHSDTTGKTANDHHNEAHTPESHTGQNATAAQLNTLVGGGAAHALHTHFKTYEWEAGDLMFPDNGDWPISAIAPADKDDLNETVKIRAFDDSAEQGVGQIFTVPAGAVNMVITPTVRPFAGVVSKTSKWNLRVQDMTGAAGSWSAAVEFEIPITDDEEWVSDALAKASKAIGVWNLTAAKRYMFELTRDATDSGDDLTGDIFLSYITVGFT